MKPTKITLACMAALTTAAVALAAPLAQAETSGAIPAVISSAVAAPDRPADDTARDALRKPGQLIAFAGIQPGQRVADINPGGGYFTRIFSHIVGAKGHVYAIVPAEIVQAHAKAGEAAKAITADATYANVSALTLPVARIATDKPLDVAWISDNYHDIYNSFGQDQALAMDKAIFQTLKPGGIFMVIDHIASAGTPLESTQKLHRIDPEIVKQQALAAGFELVETSDILRNPADPHDVPVFSPSIRGRTDQFVMKFRKPVK
jgi:predicted methyltransferase